MDIIISNTSSKPIYEQITTQIKQNIVSGVLREGDQLPSIRLLANDLGVSVITTKRAYADLERQGYLEAVQGKGCFVAGGNAELLKEEHLKAIESYLAEAIDEARVAGIGISDLHEMLDVLAEE